MIGINFGEGLRAGSIQHCMYKTNLTRTSYFVGSIQIYIRHDGVYLEPSKVARARHTHQPWPNALVAAIKQYVQRTKVALGVLAAGHPCMHTHVEGSRLLTYTSSVLLLLKGKFLFPRAVP